MDSGRRWDGRVALRRFFELLGLTGLAVAQPLLDVFGRAPEAFIAHHAGRGDLFTFAAVVTLVPALALTLIVVVTRLLDVGAARLVQTSFVAGLVALFVLQVVKEVAGAGGVLLASVGAAAFAVGVLAYRKAAIRQWLALLALGPALFAGAFLVTSPASDLLRAESVDAAELSQTGSARSVVMIVFDEWPQNSIIDADGGIDADLYPNLAALAADGAWYRNATTVSTATTAAVPALLSGRYAVDDTSPTAADHPENLFTLLASQYDLEVTESVTALCPTSLCSGPFVDDPEASAEAAEAAAAEEQRSDESALDGLLADAVDSYEAMVSLDPDASGPQAIEEVTSTVTTTTAVPQVTLDAGATDDAVDEARNAQDAPAGFPILQIDSFQGLLDSIEADEDPALHFLHLQLPHTPHRFLPDGRAYEAGGFGPSAAADVIGSRGPEQAATDADRQRLALQVGYVDRLVGQVVDRLEATGLYEDTAVVITSDHGAGFVPGQSHRGLEGEVLDRSLYPDILYVPLLVKAPQIEAGTVSDDNVESIDILPTIADILGLDVPWAVDGQSLLGAPRTDPEKRFNKVVLEGGPLGAFGGAVQVADTQTFDGDEVLAENLARNIDTLLVGDNPDHPFYALTADGDLVGTALADLDEDDPTGASLVLDDGTAAIEDYSPGDEIVPTHVTGAVEGGPRGDLRVVLTVDGVVAAVVPTFPDGDDPHRLDAMLDPEAFSGSGPHRVEAFLLTGSGGSRHLAPLDL